MVADEQQALAPPQWYRRYRGVYEAGVSHAFIFSGDVDGLALEDLSVRGFLRATLAERRDIVAIYRLAGGIEIYDADRRLPADERAGRPEQTRRERALDTIGFDAAPPGAGAGGGGGTNIAALMSQMSAPSGAPDDPFTAARASDTALNLLTTLMQRGRRVAVIIDYADALIPAPAMPGKGAMGADDRAILVGLLALAKDLAVSKLGNEVFLVARDVADLHPDLRMADSGWTHVAIPLPDRDQRLVWLAWYATNRAEQIALAEAEGTRPPPPLVFEDGLDLAELANLTAGLSLRNLEDVLLAAALSGALTRRFLKAAKDDIVTGSYSEVATMIDPLPGGFDDLGGMDQFKDYCQRRIIRALRAGKKANVPRGVLLVGPPGTGKTFGVRALAGEIGFPAVKLDAEKILGGIVGESERKLATFFGFVRSLAPAVVFVDELDQTDMAQRGDQSGNPVAKNIFNGMMQFMSDETLRGDVIVIFASNRPDKIDPAMKRSGRIDAIIPLLLPERDQRRQIAEVQAEGQGVGIAQEALDRLADDTELWNAADLAEVIREARIAVEEDDRDTILVPDIATALDDLRPSGLDTAEQFTLLAVQAVNKKQYLPERWRARLNDRSQLDRDLAAIEAQRPAPLGRERYARDARD